MEKLNFKKWLKEQGVDTKYFWNQCKKKNQGWSFKLDYIKRSELKKMGAKEWITFAFNFGETKQGTRYWGEIEKEWYKVVDKYVSNGESHKIKFGFGKDKNENK